MALTDKEAAVRIVEQLPDDVSWDDILRALMTLSNAAGRNGSSVTSASSGASLDEREDGSDASVSYHLEREGWATVLVPDRPVPPITADLVNELIEEMRRERDGGWLGQAKHDGE